MTQKDKKQNSIAKKMAKYSIEFVIVAFGVFLGLWVSEWTNERKTIVKKEKSIQYIKEEIESNKTSLLKTIEYHKLIKVGFDSLSKNLTLREKMVPYLESKSFNHNQINGWFGLRLPEFEDVAFEGAKISGIIQEYDFKLIQEMAKVYKTQAFISEFGKSILNNMIDANSSTKTIDVISILELLTRDFLFAEEELLQDYSQIIEIVESNHL